MMSFSRLFSEGGSAVKVAKQVDLGGGGLFEGGDDVTKVNRKGWWLISPVKMIRKWAVVGVRFCGGW